MRMRGEKIKVLGIIFLLIICFCYILNINTTTLICCFVSLIIGISIGSGIIANIDKIQGIIDKKFEKKYIMNEDMVNNKKVEGIERNRYSENMLFYVEEELNGKVELFLEKIIERYINSWYLSEFENDTAFIGEIRHHCCYAGRKILSLIKKTDFESVIIEEIFPQILLHFYRMGNCDNKIKEDNIILSDFFKDDTHYSLRENFNCKKYLNILSEKVLKKIIDVKRISGKVGDSSSLNGTWPSKSGLYLLQDLITNYIFYPIVEFLSEPDNINKLFLQIIDGSSSNVYEINDNKKNVMFLYGLEENIHSALQDSLLQVKLSTIIKNPRLLQTFEIFLEDFNGPLALLQILKNLDSIHKILIKIDKVDDNELVLREIEFDLHQIYATWKVFVIENEKEIIKLNTAFFNESIFKGLKNDLDNKNIQAIDKVMEEAYRKVYEIISKNFVIPFSQSECYFGYLCGSSPVDVDQFQFSNNTLTTNGNKSNNCEKIPENSLSFSSFRKRVWSVMVPNTTNFSNDDNNEEIIDDCYEMTPSVETPLDTAEYNNLGILTVLKSSTKLSIRIEDIEMRRDSITSRMYYVYAIAVISTDISTPEPTSVEWVVLRKPEEFYTLQQKLLEKHGSALAQFQPLPPKKSITSRDKIALLENLPSFECFLNDINHHSLLQKSDLFFNFLSSPDEFKDSLTLSELNPWRIVKKVPQKLSREKGKNLKSFILNSLANLLASPSSTIYGYYGRSHSNFDTFSFNDNMSNSSICESGDVILNNKYKNNISNKNRNYSNTSVSKCDGINCINECLCLSLEIDKKEKPTFYNTLLTFILKITSLPKWILCPLLFIEYLFSNVISSYMKNYLSKEINMLLVPSIFSNIISSLHSTIFDPNYEIVTTEEKNLRRQLARRKFIDLSLSIIPFYSYFKIHLKKYEHSIENIFNSSQCQELNKQLVIVVLDKIIDNIFNK
ncbi:Sorting nexin-14 [Strongyloides ratti]|uniref:Sorting nexin-14 n=1 Tax=Strongyloides ratti TaxID=34506 RepID=A0A090L3M1_STRRB|nr:Sorting nexin-14 [Strongyloides ratti]CEF64411.1 Sorting nexin-14 [Strongyloides ratti]